MLDRCYNPANASYKHYGERGITVCDEWQISREAFTQWSNENGHAMDLSIDRIDNEQGYSPDNCRWADMKTQLRNKRLANMVDFDGDVRNLYAWAEDLGINGSTLWRRIMKYGKTPQEALKKGRLNENTDWQHGTRAGYEGNGCRCDLCKASNNKRARDFRAARKAKGDEK